ncbi:hypothetical protein VKT23_011927 [Stygiomarasmius scandens]|uniref:Uncharacterized protein n=1 Tax=Marasmiellus scandens TaxID=2682957 RepID=A0ABR1JA04_9AGAR
MHRRHPASQDNLISISVGSSTSHSLRLIYCCTTNVAASQGVPTIPVTPPVLPIPFLQPWDESGLGLNFSTQATFSKTRPTPLLSIPVDPSLCPRSGLTRSLLRNQIYPY